MPQLGPVVAAAVVAAALAGIWIGRPAASPVATRVGDVHRPGVVTEVSGQSMTVHVAGAVAHPGLVELSAGARVADAVAAAGGATPEAALAGLNLAQELVDGQQVVVPNASDLGHLGAEDAGPIRLNSAGIDQLETLSGVGPVLAAAIVSHRDEHGPFMAVEDLLSVPGIGEAKLASIRDHVSVP